MPSVHRFDRSHLRAMHLAGTVAIPSPFPEVGKVSLMPGGLTYNGSGEAEDLVLIEHVQSNRLVIRRTVRLQDVSAVVFTDSVKPSELSLENWFFGPEIAGQLETRSSSNKPDLMMGIAYVRENAPVLMHVEVGMTAAESVEYYPPAVGERSDRHYALTKTASPPRPKRDCDGCDGCFGP